jgi:hypothetical protein
MNISKMNDPRFWIKWHAAGAVRREQFPEGALTISGIGTHFSGPAAGYSTLSLGEKVVNSGPGWSVSEPLCAIVVPTSEKYRFGVPLKRIPGNAIPVETFFANVHD